MENTTEKKKAIAWVRCSTDRQHTASEQYEKILAMAIKDGYKETDIVKIGREGASAIKVDAAYTADLEQMYNLFNAGIVQTVYAWAVDRIGRDQKENTFFKFKLLDCGIELKTVEGVTFNSNSKDPMAGLLLDLKQRIAEDEMNKKMARFKIGKDKNRKLGRWNGGKVCYGYKVDKDGYFEVDEETANVVRRIFNTYINTNESTTTIARALYNEGITDRKTEKGRTNFVLHILKNKNYLGVHPFSRLITDEDFEKAQAKMKGCKFQPRHTQNTCENYAHGLLRVKNDAAKNGYFMMTIRRRDGQYVECNSRYCVDADTIDSLLLSSANRFVKEYNAIDTESKVKEIKDKIETLTAQTGVMTKRVEQIDNKMQRLEKSYIEGITKKEKRDLMQNDYMTEKKRTLEQIDELQQDIMDLNNRLDSIQNGLVDDLYSLNDKDRTREIAKIIDFCEVERVANGTYNIYVHYKYVGVELYQIKSKAHKYYTIEDDELEPIEINKLNRYTSNRVRNKKTVELKKAA